MPLHKGAELLLLHNIQMVFILFIVYHPQFLFCKHVELLQVFLIIVEKVGRVLDEVYHLKNLLILLQPQVTQENVHQNSILVTQLPHYTTVDIQSQIIFLVEVVGES